MAGEVRLHGSGLPKITRRVHGRDKIHTQSLRHPHSTSALGGATQGKCSEACQNKHFFKTPEGQSLGGLLKEWQLYAASIVISEEAHWAKSPLQKPGDMRGGRVCRMAAKPQRILFIIYKCVNWYFHYQLAVQPMLRLANKHTPSTKAFQHLLDVLL